MPPPVKSKVSSASPAPVSAPPAERLLRTPARRRTTMPSGLSMQVMRSPVSSTRNATRSTMCLAARAPGVDIDPIGAHVRRFLLLFQQAKSRASQATDFRPDEFWSTGLRRLRSSCLHRAVLEGERRLGQSDLQIADDNLIAVMKA